MAELRGLSEPAKPASEQCALTSQSPLPGADRHSCADACFPPPILGDAESSSVARCDASASPRTTRSADGSDPRPPPLPPAWPKLTWAGAAAAGGRASGSRCLRHAWSPTPRRVRTHSLLAPSCRHVHAVTDREMCRRGRKCGGGGDAAEPAPGAAERLGVRRIGEVLLGGWRRRRGEQTHVTPMAIAQNTHIDRLMRTREPLRAGPRRRRP